jgi:hypothetical protein
MNNAILLQVCFSNSPFIELIEVSVVQHLKYIRKHNMDFDLVISDTEPIVSGFTKITIADCWLKQYEYVFYLDADAMIVDTSVDLRTAFYGSGAAVLMARHPSMYNTGVIFLHWVKGMDAVMQQWLEGHPANIAEGKRVWDEQVIINRMMEEPRFAGLIAGMDDKWNSSFRTNESPHPVISAWHGACDDNGIRDIGLVAQWMRAALQSAK